MQRLAGELHLPSSQPDTPAQRSVQHAQLSVPKAPAQPSAHRTRLDQRAQTTELSQTIGNVTTSINTNHQRTQGLNEIPILLRSHHCIVCHQPHEQRELGTAQL